MKILNIGSCNIDYVYSLDHIVAEGETERSDSVNTFAGGKGLNQSIAAAKAGAKVYHAACVGSDGNILTNALEENGVDISLIKRSEAKNGHAIIQVSKSGENSIFLYPGTNEMIEKKYIDDVLCRFDEGDILMLQNEINNIDYIVERAYKKKMTIILNPSPINDELSKIDMNMISYIILNKIEATSLFDSDNIRICTENAVKRYPMLRIILTNGVKGSIYKSADKTLYQNAFKAKVADTTAAGDTFMGYFVAGLANGLEIGQILRTASAASAITVSRSGAAPSIPWVAEVEKKISSMEERSNNFDDDNLKKRIDDYISNHLKDLSVEALAKELNYSYYSVRTMIKKITGKNFTDYVGEKRLAIGEKLLLETNLPISEIINMSGYENESYFRRKFKEKYGTSPNQYRKARSK